jgi:hypothetical protein
MKSSGNYRFNIIKWSHIWVICTRKCVVGRCGSLWGTMTSLRLSGDLRTNPQPTASTPTTTSHDYKMLSLPWRLRISWIFWTGMPTSELARIVGHLLKRCIILDGSSVQYFFFILNCSPASVLSSNDIAEILDRLSFECGSWRPTLWNGSTVMLENWRTGFRVSWKKITINEIIWKLSIWYNKVKSDLSYLYEKGVYWRCGSLPVG